MVALYHSASENKPEQEAVAIAELMREVGLKCIGFNGVRDMTLPHALLHMLIVQRRFPAR